MNEPTQEHKRMAADTLETTCILETDSPEACDVCREVATWLREKSGTYETAVDVLLLEIKEQERHLAEIEADRAHHTQRVQDCHDKATVTLQQIVNLKAAVRQLGGG